MRLDQLIEDLTALRARIGWNAEVVLRVDGEDFVPAAVVSDSHACDDYDGDCTCCKPAPAGSEVDQGVISNDPDEGRDYAWESEARLRAMERGGW